MGYVRARIEELRKAGLKMDQAVVEKYLIHPGEVWREAEEKVEPTGSNRKKNEKGIASIVDPEKSRGGQYEER